MMLFKASFQKKASTTLDEFRDHVLSYMSALLLNGQVSCDYQYGWQDDKIIVTVHMPKTTSISRRNNSARAKEALADLRKVLLDNPQWEHLATDRNGRYSSWRHAPYLYLYTSALTIEPPICCGDNGKQVPTYQIPMDSAHIEDVYYWAHRYALYDNMWLNSSTLEKAAYRELTSLDSELTREGRGICKEVEAATNKPTYYYLMHYYRNRKREAVCPGCKGPWQIGSPVNEQPFWHFHFKCDKCKLISHFASD